METSNDSDLRRFCTFAVCGQLYGLPVDHVQEVLRSHAATRMPLVPATMAGLINLRGDIVMTFDLRRRLGGARSITGDGTFPDPMHVVVRTDDGVISVLVDEVLDVIELSADGLESVPMNTDRRLRDVCIGIHQLDRDVLVVLDVDRLFEPDAPSATLPPTDIKQGALP